MIQIELKKKFSDRYHIVRFKDVPLDFLADFLVRNGSCKYDFNANYEHDLYIVWLRDKNPDNERISGNTMEMIKKDGKIYLDSQFRDNTEDWSEAFSTTPENMIHILMSWYDILAMNPRPDEVHLIQEGDKIIVLPKLCLSEDELFAAIGLKR